MQLIRQLPQVTKLRVGPNCTDGDLDGLSEASTLTELNLSNSKVGDRGLVHLRGLASLTRLDLSGTLISDDAGQDIATHQGLVMLHLGRTKVGDATLEQLTALTHLNTLLIDGADVTARGLAALGVLPTWNTYMFVRSLKSRTTMLMHYSGHFPIVELFDAVLVDAASCGPNRLDEAPWYQQPGRTNPYLPLLCAETPLRALSPRHLRSWR